MGVPVCIHRTQGKCMSVHSQDYAMQNAAKETIIFQTII